MSKSTTKRQTVSILGFTEPSPKEKERMAAQHLIDTKLHNHPTVKKIRGEIERAVMKAGPRVTGKATRG